MWGAGPGLQTQVLNQGLTLQPSINEDFACGRNATMMLSADRSTSGIVQSFRQKDAEISTVQKGDRVVRSFQYGLDLVI